jgi:hypothetical protein
VGCEAWGHIGQLGKEQAITGGESECFAEQSVERICNFGPDDSEGCRKIGR